MFHALRPSTFQKVYRVGHQLVQVAQSTDPLPHLLVSFCWFLSFLTIYPDYGVFHFGSKPYLEITAPFLTILGQNFDMSKFRISNDPSAPKNYFKNFKYDRNMRLFTGSISLDKIKMTFDVTFSIDFERIDKLKLQVSEGYDNNSYLLFDCMLSSDLSVQSFYLNF